MVLPCGSCWSCTGVLGGNFRAEVGSVGHDGGLLCVIREKMEMKDRDGGQWRKSLGGFLMSGQMAKQVVLSGLETRMTAPGMT